MDVSPRTVIPRLPIVLLAIVACLYALHAIADLRLGRIKEIVIEAPVIELGDGTHGAWKIEWPEWPARKGAPILCAEGRSYYNTITSPPAKAYLRVVPQDCVHFSEDTPIDANGWFQAVELNDGSMRAQLEPGRACAIEYEARNFGSLAPARLQLKVRGARDWLIAKDLIVNRGIRNDLAGIASIPLVIWLMVGKNMRRRAARLGGVAKE